MSQDDHPKIFKLSSINKFVFFILLTIFVVTGLMTLWLLNKGNYSQSLATIVTVIGLISGVGLLGLFYLSWRHFTLFSNDINQWSSGLIKGDLSSRMKTDFNSPSAEIRTQINKISDDYESLSSVVAGTALQRRII